MIEEDAVARRAAGVATNVMDRVAPQDVGHGAFKQDQRDVNLIVFQATSHCACAAEKVLVFNADTGRCERTFFQGEMPREVEVFGDATDTQRNWFAQVICSQQ